MSAKRKKRKPHMYSAEESAAAKNALREKAHHFNFRLAGILIGIFIAISITYYSLLHFHVIWATPVLYIFASVLFLTFFFVNRGFSNKPVEYSILPNTWTEERKAAFLADDRKRKIFAKKLMILMVPTLLLVGIDILLLLILPLL